MPQFVQAGRWGLLGGSALLVGAAVAYLVALPQRLVAGIMAMGAGVLISAVAFDLMDEAYKRGGSIRRHWVSLVMLPSIRLPTWSFLGEAPSIASDLAPILMPRCPQALRGPV